MKWLLKTLGVGDDLLARLDQATLAVQRPGLLWVGLALLVPISFFIIRRQQRNLATIAPGLRIALSATRIGVLTALVVVLAGPYLKIDYQIDRRPVVALVFDHSQSMQLPAGPFDGAGESAKIAQAAGYHVSPGESDAETTKALNQIGRAKLAQAVVQANAKTLTEPLAAKFDVRYYAFSREPQALGVDPAHPQFPDPPNPGGPSTHLGDAIGRVLDDAAGRQVAGLFLFSDGQNTGGRSPSEAAGAAARAGAPVFAVPAGSSARQSDVAIVDVFTSGLVSVGDTARIAVTLESQGFDNRPIKVELRDGETVIDTEDVTLRGGEQQKVELTFEAKEPGAKYLTVRVPPLPEEPEHLKPNNTDIAFVRVSDERLKVLFLEGQPRWDFRFLKNAMRRDNGIGGRAEKDQPDIVLESELRRQPAEARSKALPATVDQLAEYHTVILGDASPELITPAFAANLAEAVRERGLGLIVAAGSQHTPHDSDAKLKELLPVKLRPSVSGLDAPVYRPFKLELSPDGSIHEVMRLYDDPGKNQNAWRQMPAYYWCAAVERPAPAAAVLAWNPSVEGRFGKLPLIAYHYAGRGRVLFVGTDATYLWRQNVGDRFFYKFWGQGVRFVARRDDAKAKQSWIEVRPVRAQPGEEAQVELMAFAADGSPRIDPMLNVQVAGEGVAKSLEVVADPSTKGRYLGKLTLERAGDYRLSFDPGGGAKAAEARIRVMIAPEELRHPAVNRPALELLASATNGKLVELTDLASIPPTLKGESKLTQVHREASLWDNWLTLVIVMFVYSLDVALRRLAGLS
jgi:hypothetical protein